MSAPQPAARPLPEGSLGWPVLAVVLGGALGTGLRLAVDLALPHSGSGFPTGTLLINLVGSFALGLLVGRLWRTAAEWLKAGLGPGLLGSFTTFSALAVSTIELVEADAIGLALGYVAASVVGGLAAAAVGLRLGGRSVPSNEVDE